MPKGPRTKVLAVLDLGARIVRRRDCAPASLGPGPAASSTALI